jgi:hypothetical protein
LNRIKKSTNYKKQSIGITMVTAAEVALASLLLAGTILAPTQAAAISQHSKSDTVGLKDSIRDGVTVNLERSSQHMGQENLCVRSNTCRQSDVGQNTLGNDNQVTGFTDPSDNLQQTQTPTPTPTTNPTPTPTTNPTPTPTTIPGA